MTGSVTVAVVSLALAFGAVVSISACIHECARAEADIGGHSTNCWEVRKNCESLSGCCFCTASYRLPEAWKSDAKEQT